MSLSRSEIMMITNKEIAFNEISMKQEWDGHRKAAERSSWKKKHEPKTIKKCPNRGRRYNNHNKKEKENYIHKEKENISIDTNISITMNTNKVKSKPIKNKKNMNSFPPPPEEDNDPCQICHNMSEGYDFPCSHPICYPCYSNFFKENNGHIKCKTCGTEYEFEDNIVDEND